MPLFRRTPTQGRADRLRQFDAEWATGDRDTARQMAYSYANEFPARLEAFRLLSVEEIVAAVDEARLSGDSETRTEADIYLIARMAPQHIVGRMG